jgi:hypothetical protein
MARNFTRELKLAQANGRVVVAGMQPARGERVAYTPRSKGDPAPWLRTDSEGAEWRYSGRECYAAEACGHKLLHLTRGMTACTLPAGHDKAHRSV